MVTAVPTKGLRIYLASTHKLYLNDSGDFFYDVPSQNVLRSGEMGRFLARAEYDREQESILFGQTSNGREVLSRSRPLRGNHEIPRSELDALEIVFKEFRLKSQEEKLPPRSTEIMTSFRLPDPDREPEMYRMCNGKGGKQLVVLWGCERESGSSVSLEEAIVKLRRRAIPVWRVWAERCLWLLLLLAALGLLSWLAITFIPRMIGNSQAPTLSVLTDKPYSKQFLSVQIEDASGVIPNAISAWSNKPGVVMISGPDVKDARRQQVEADEHVIANVDQTGEYRVEWTPDDRQLNSEFVVIEFRVDEPAIVLSPSDTKPLNTAEGIPELAASALPSDRNRPVISNDSDGGNEKKSPVLSRNEGEDDILDSIAPGERVAEPSEKPTQSPGKLSSMPAHLEKLKDPEGRVVLKVVLTSKPNLVFEKVAWQVDGVRADETSNQLVLPVTKETQRVRAAGYYGGTWHYADAHVDVTVTPLDSDSSRAPRP